MKKYYVSERFFSIGDSFDIYDESGNIAYYGKQILFSLKKQYKLFNIKNELVAYINQKLFRLMACYDLIMNEKKVATVQKKFSFFLARYDIISDFGIYAISGDLFDWDFEITKNGEPVCHVHKNFTIFKDRYEVIIDDSFDPVFALSLVIILDAVHHDRHH